MATIEERTKARNFLNQQKNLRLTQVSIENFWDKKEKERPGINVVIKAMSEQERSWVVDNTTEMITSITKLGEALASSEYKDEYFMSPEQIDKLLNIMAYLSSATTFRIMSWLDENRNPVMHKIIVTIADPTIMTETEDGRATPAGLLIDRMALKRFWIILRKMKGQKLMRATTLKKVFPANRMGRDFVIGDIHGCYDDVMRLLSFVQFNRYNDRLFSVGDLIHRGDKSEECLSLLKESWFFSALGNHDVLEDQSVEQFAQYNVNHKPYEKEMEQMLFLMEVKHDVFGSFFVTHGELESNVLFCLNNHSIKHDLTSDIDVHKNLFQSDKHNLDFVEQDMSDTILEIIQSPHWKPSANQIIDSIWSREIFNNFFSRFHNEIYDHDFSFLQQFTERVNKLKIFCGHSIVPFPMAIGN